MAEVNPPWTLQNLATHTANVHRDHLLLQAGGAEGVMGASGLGKLAVTQRGAGANMSVDVAAGIATIMGDENNVQGLYGCVNDAAKNVVIAAADPTNPRFDLIVARIQDAFYSGGTNAWSLAVIQGTPAASPADPAMLNNAICLARVTVPAAAGSIVTGNIADLRPFAPLGVIPGNSARRPGVLYGAFSQEPAFKTIPTAGQRFYEIDTNLEYVFNGTAWVCVTPQSVTTSTSQPILSTGAYVDLATVGPIVTAQTGTKALITLSSAFNSTQNTLVNVGFAISGATTAAASDVNALGPVNITATNNGAGARTFTLTGLTPGANIFTMKYKATVITTTSFLNRDLTVVGLP